MLPGTYFPCILYIGILVIQDKVLIILFLVSQPCIGSARGSLCLSDPNTTLTTIDATGRYREKADQMSSMTSQFRLHVTRNVILIPSNAYVRIFCSMP